MIIKRWHRTITICQILLHHFYSKSLTSLLQRRFCLLLKKTFRRDFVVVYFYERVAFAFRNFVFLFMFDCFAIVSSLFLCLFSIVSSFARVAWIIIHAFHTFDMFYFDKIEIIRNFDIVETMNKTNMKKRQTKIKILSRKIFDDEFENFRLIDQIIWFSKNAYLINRWMILMFFISKTIREFMWKNNFFVKKNVAIDNLNYE